MAAFLAVVYNDQALFCILADGIFGAVLHQDALNLGQVAYCVKNGFQEV
jgi:hypothetical protein